MSVASRLAEVRERIARATAAAGREPASVKLIAVSKMQPADRVREAYEAGHRAFGENYAQELAAKAEALADLPDIEWHFIGHLQTNKARVVAAHAHVVHTVDSAGLARELGKRAAATKGERPGPMPVLVEVSVAGEAQKTGVAPGEIEAVMHAIAEQPSLAVRGLMAMPPADDLEAARRVFTALAALRDRHGGAARLPELSMGMSQDLDVAVACGATLVRVGTAIFGERDA